MTIIESNLKNLTKEKLKNIKLLVSDLDGIMVPRGTKIKQVGDKTTFELKRLKKEQIKQIKELHKKGFMINISSGRSLYFLQEMFREVLPLITITYENGSASWINGKIYQHVNSSKHLEKIYPELKKVKNKKIKGFEPKEFIISIHCTSRIKKIEDIVKKYQKLYYIWNGEAYDIGIKKIQTKAEGLKKLMKILKLKKKNVLALGDNYNDKELLKLAGISVSADKRKLKGDYYVKLSRKNLPAGVVMRHILNL